MWQIEVRTPTYRRPELLERALGSLVRQTYPHWRCIVLDDMPGAGTARDVCARLNDERIIYQPNSHNLGVGANIDAAFSRPPLPGSTHACVLEDDNYYLPDFMAANLSVMAEHQVDIVLRNQLIELPSAPNTEGEIVQGTVFNGQYVEGVASHEELWATFFFSRASNLALFWRLGRDLCFSTIKFTDDAILQERLRVLRIDRSVYVAIEPKAVWRENGPESTRPRAQGLSWYRGQIRWACSERKLYQALYKHLRKRGATDKIWNSRLRKFDARCERVFRRVGIRPPIPSHFSAQERAILSLKREVARAMGILVAEPIRYRLVDRRLEEA